MRFLAPMGFEICILDTMSIKDQAILFAQAEVII